MILGFIIIINGHGRKVFLLGILAASILTAIDLIWSTIKFSSLNIQSLVKFYLLHDHEGNNHNPLAMVCALGLIMIYYAFIKKQVSILISGSIILLLSLGIMLSTSRSTILAIILVLIILFLVQKEIQFNIKKIMTMVIGFTTFFISFYFLYHALISSGDFKSSFIDQAYYRLYEEPISLLGGNEKKVFNERGNEKKSNTEWRYNRSMKDLAKYSRLNLKTQLFGLGTGGYINENFGDDFFADQQFDAHNGYVLILVERGLIGLLIFIFIMVVLSYKSFKQLRYGLIDTPIVYPFLIIAIYAIGQNAELTAQLAFLFLGAMIGNTKEALASEYIVDNNKQESFAETENQFVHNKENLINS